MNFEKNNTENIHKQSAEESEVGNTGNEALKEEESKQTIEEKEVNNTDNKIENTEDINNVLGNDPIILKLKVDNLYNKLQEAILRADQTNSEEDIKKVRDITKQHQDSTNKLIKIQKPEKDSSSEDPYIKYDVALRDALAKTNDFKWIGTFNDGIAKVIDKNNETYLINIMGVKIYADDTKGRDSISDVGEFKDGIAWVKMNGRKFFITSKGERAFDIVFSSGGEFRDGIAWIGERTGGGGYKKYFINTKGEKVFDHNFDDVAGFSNGFSSVIDNNGEKFYINTKGERVFNETFDYARGFNDGLAWVVKRHRNKFIEFFAGDSYKEETYFINTKGEKAFDGSFDKVDDFGDGLASVQDTNGEKYFINTKGEKVFEDTFNNIGTFNNGLTWVLKGDSSSYHFINTEGEKAFDETFDYAGSFEDGVALVKKDGEKFFINTKGERVFS